MILLNKIRMGIYALFLTNISAFKLKKLNSSKQKKEIITEYSHKLFSKLNIEVKVKNKNNLPANGQFLVVLNHRSIIDPLIVQIALEDTDIFGLWISKQELRNSLFFGAFVRHAGTITLDRDSKSKSDFFKRIKVAVKEGNSIFIFPEGTRNKEKTELSSFKKGSQMIALKNKLPILPIYIRTNADDALQLALQDNSKTVEIEVEIGELIDYKTKLGVEELYRSTFKLQAINKESE